MDSLMEEIQRRLTILIVGPKDSGKTVYISSFVSCPSIFIGAESVKYLRINWDNLVAGVKVSATHSMFKDMTFNYKGNAWGRDYNVDLIIPDYDGQFAEKLSSAGYDAVVDEPNTGEKAEDGVPKISNSLKLKESVQYADGYIIFMPVEDNPGDYKGMVLEINAFIDYIQQQFLGVSTLEVPLVIAVNKWDRSPAFKQRDEDQAALNYIKSVKAYNTLYERLRNYFSTIAVMPVSAYGHKSPDNDTPVKGAMAPYNVDKPVAWLVKENFAILERNLKNSRAKGPADVAMDLLASRPVWERNDANNYKEELEKALADAASNLISSLGQAKGIVEFETISKSRPENKLFDNFSEDIHQKIDQIRAQCLSESYKHLKEELSSKKSLRQYDSTMASEPEGSYWEQFTPAQKEELDSLRRPLEKRERSTRAKRKAISVIIFIMVALGAWYGYQYWAFDNDYKEAMNNANPNQFSALTAFVRSYDGSFIAQKFYPEQMREAVIKRENMLASVSSSLQVRLNAAKNQGDVCAQAREAELLIEEVTIGEISLPSNLDHELRLFAQQSTESCEQKKITENEEKERKALQAQAEEEEARRVAEIQAQIRELAFGPGNCKFQEAVNFIQEYGQERSEEILHKINEVSSSLPERAYCEATSIIKDTGSIQNKVDRLNELLKSPYGQIDTRHRDTLASEIQKIAEEEDTKNISAIRPPYKNRIDSASDLALLKEKLGKLDNIIDEMRVDQVFTYSRPDSLKREIRELENLRDRYDNIIKYGISGTLIVKARSKKDNSLELDCTGWGTANNELIITGELGSHNWKDPGASCVSTNGGSEHSFNGAHIRSVQGRVTLTEDNKYGFDDISCSGTVNVSENDLIDIYNKYEKQLNFNGCYGINLYFSR